MSTRITVGRPVMVEVRNSMVLLLSSTETTVPVASKDGPENTSGVFGVVAAGAAAGTGTPMPKLKVPASSSPSSADLVFQVTVYTPGVRPDLSPTVMVFFGVALVT